MTHQGDIGDMGVFGTLCNIMHEVRNQVPPTNLDVLIAKYETLHHFSCCNS